jgi:hypothetical protein
MGDYGHGGGDTQTYINAADGGTIVVARSLHRSWAPSRRHTTSPPLVHARVDPRHR